MIEHEEIKVPYPKITFIPEATYFDWYNNSLFKYISSNSISTLDKHEDNEQTYNNSKWFEKRVNLSLILLLKNPK